MAANKDTCRFTPNDGIVGGGIVFLLIPFPLSIYAMYGTGPGGSPQRWIFPLSIFLVGLAMALLRNIYTFDFSRRKIIREAGVWPFVKRWEDVIPPVRSIEINAFSLRSGIDYTATIQYISSDQGNIKLLHESKPDKAIQSARELAAALNVPVIPGEFWKKYAPEKAKALLDS